MEVICAWEERGNLKIEILKFNAMPVDTNSINTAYVTVQALSKALATPIPGLTIDEQAKFFISDDLARVL